MYTYPNGLKCQAPTWRIRAYESTVPFLALVALLGGMGFIGVEAAGWLKGQEPGLISACKAFLLFSLGSVVWGLIITIVAMAIFQVWCKPISSGSPSTN